MAHVSNACGNCRSPPQATNKERIDSWKNKHKGNVRGLLGSLQTVLWEGSGWAPLGMGDLLEPNQVRVRDILCLRMRELLCACFVHLLRSPECRRPGAASTGAVFSLVQVHAPNP